jgi:hypothetical protein
MAVSAGIHDEEVKVVVGGHVMEIRVTSEGVGESHPRSKEMGMVGSGQSHDAVAGICHCSAEISTECIMVGRQHEHQGMSYGKWVSK